MGKARFLYNNLIIDETMLSVSSLRAGLITTALKSGTGSATIFVTGDYSGSVDKEFIVEIDSVADGTEIGQATFRWSDGGGAWNATGVATGASNIALGDGVYVKWAAGGGDDFSLGDRWYVKGINLFNAGKMINLDRDSRYRSVSLGSPNTISVDFGSAREIKALILWDHNLTSGATITIKGNAADADWGTPAFSERVPGALTKILHYLSSVQTYRYWRIEITDAGNPDNYIEIGEIFLGSYAEPTVNFSQGYSRDNSFLMETGGTPYGVRRHRFYNKPKKFTYSWKKIPEADMELFEGIADALCNRSEGTFKPLWFNEDSSRPGNTWLVWLSGLPRTHADLEYFDTTVEMEEVLASV